MENNIGNWYYKKIYSFILLVIAVFSLSSCANNKVEEKNVVVELGDEISKDPKDYVIANKESLYEEMTVDISDVEKDKVGMYDVRITCGKKVYVSKLEIKDTTPPQLIEESGYCVIAPQSYEVASNLMGDVEDYSECAAYFISCDYIGSIEDFNIDTLDSLEPEITTGDFNDIKTLIVVEDFEKEGHYEVVIGISDESNNVTILKKKVFVDGTAPTMNNTNLEMTVDASEFTSEATNARQYFIDLHEQLLNNNVKVDCTDNISKNITVSTPSFLFDCVESFSENMMVENVIVGCIIKDEVGNENYYQANCKVTYRGTFDKRIKDMLLNECYIKESDISNNTIQTPSSESNNKKENSQVSTGTTNNTGNTGSSNNDQSDGFKIIGFTEGQKDDHAQTLFNLINQERVANGLNQLTWNSNIEKLAKERAVEISTNFSHIREDGTSVANYNLTTGCYNTDGTYWIGKNNISLGENIGENMILNVYSIHNSFMNSQGHKNNILDNISTDGAVAVYQASNGLCYYVEIFE